MTLDAKIEAILFWKGEPVNIKNLAKILEVSPEDIETSLKELEANLVDRGVTLQRLEDEVSLGTTKDMGETIEKLTKEELIKDLGKAGLETLTIIMYRGPVRRSEIDYIRGVNSQFILRNLLVRGLVERIPDDKDERSYLYKPTFDLLSHLGISRVEDMPEFETMKKQIETHADERES